MSEPISYQSHSENLNLPLLFAGQAQKEFFVNQSLAMIDALIPRTVIGTAAIPPIDVADGQSYIVEDQGTSDWAGHDHSLALRIAGAWQFIKPVEGMCVFSRQDGQILLYRTSWVAVSEPENPSGGSVVDTEARAALTALIESLKAIGIFRAP